MIFKTQYIMQNNIRCLSHCGLGILFSTSHPLSATASATRCYFDNLHSVIYWRRIKENLFLEIGHLKSMQKQSFIYNKKKAVLSQRWPRDARYITRSWAVAEIWPFEINQDGGGRYLEFVRIENSAIRSAVPENPALEQNMKWIGRPVAEISPLEIFPRWR